MPSAACNIVVVVALAGGTVGAAPAGQRTRSRPAATEVLRIKRVVLRGVRTGSVAALQQAADGAVPPGRFDGAARRRIREAVRRRVVSVYERRGYARVRVRVREVRPGPQTSFVLFGVDIDEGAIHRVGAIDVVGVSGPEDRLAALRRVQSRSGRPLVPATLAADRARIAALFADRGHAFAKVGVRLQPHTGRPYVDVIFRVVVGPVYRVGALVLRGASQTAATLVRRAILLKAGDRYHRTTLTEALARLRRTGAFVAVALREEPLARRRVRLVITVRERQPR